jgi:Fe-S cluster assembly protein SufD
MTAVSEQIGSWLEAFTKQDASPFQALREAGFHKFAEVGFPSTHDEEWRFTNVSPIARGSFVAAAPVAPSDIDSLAP